MTGQRLRDAIVATAALGLLAPVIAGLAIMVLVSDGRPVLFRQMRSGRNGLAFALWKFRTMDMRRDDHGNLLPDTQRMTRFGRVLRRLRLDELPQFLNVLLGTMSLVGPRPLLPATIAAAGETGRLRGLVRPGLTGWAQVNGNALLTDRDKLALDLWYVANRSIAIDFAILRRTALVLVQGERINPDAIRRARASGSGRCG